MLKICRKAAGSLASLSATNLLPLVRHRTTNTVVRKQRLPPYPQINTITELKPELYLPSNFTTVRYGDYEFKQCPDGYVHIFVQAYKNERGLPSNSAAAFAVFYGENHPLNVIGPVERSQEFCHARRFGFMRALQTIPEGLFSKTSLCVNGRAFLTYIDAYLRDGSDNSFRNIRSGRIMSDLETGMEINRLLRTRTDLTFQLKYVPDAIRMPDMYRAKRMAIEEADRLTLIMRHERSTAEQCAGEFLLGD